MQASTKYLDPVAKVIEFDLDLVNLYPWQPAQHDLFWFCFWRDTKTTDFYQLRMNSRKNNNKKVTSSAIK